MIGQILYRDRPSLGLPGMPYRIGGQVLTKVNNTRLHQIDQGTMVSTNFGEDYGVTIQGVAVTIISTGDVNIDAVALAAAINGTGALAGIVEKAEAVADDIFVTYFDYLPHLVMTSIAAANSDVTPIAISQVANAGQNFRFGIGLIADVTDGIGESVKLPAGAFNEALFQGIVRWDHLAPSYGLPGQEAVPANHPVDMVRKGFFWVRINQNVAIGDPVFLQHTVNGTKLPGEFRMNNDTGNAGQLTKGAAWHRAGTATSGKAVLEINLVG